LIFISTRPNVIARFNHTTAALIYQIKQGDCGCSRAFVTFRKSEQ